MLHLPVGINAFDSIRTGGFVYVEKTEHVHHIEAVQATEVEGNPALEQVQAKGYSEKYQGRPGMAVYELGLVFSKADRNLIALDGRAVASLPKTAPSAR